MTTRNDFTDAHEQWVNWLAVLVLLSLGFMWPPALPQHAERVSAPQAVRADHLLLASSADRERIEAPR